MDPTTFSRLLQDIKQVIRYKFAYESCETLITQPYVYFPEAIFQRQEGNITAILSTLLLCTTGKHEVHTISSNFHAHLLNSPHPRAAPCPGP